jgi:cytochrome oxidase Cu insertion factor (SCO1/SenC/PrrC family)
MMHNMVPGMNIDILFWEMIGVLFCLILLVTFIWLAVHWLKQQKTHLMQNAAQPKVASEEYQQGYQAQLPLPKTSQEGEQLSPYPLDEQPQAQPLEKLPLQHSSLSGSSRYS